MPLIIEKIYRDSIVPTVRKSPVLSWLDRNANWLLCRLVGLKLKKTFGGELTFFGIGGAKLDIEVERFLLKSGFPYAVGYGLTETSPLLSFTLGKIRVPGSIGMPVSGVQSRDGRRGDCCKGTQRDARLLQGSAADSEGLHERLVVSYQRPCRG